MRILTLFLLVACCFSASAQSSSNTQINDSKVTELVMSMSQRSLVMPGYLTELKALVAQQAYSFWKNGTVEPYVSHLNVYSALYEANKYLGFDSTKMMAYNQVGFHSKKVTSIVFGEDPNTYYSSSADGTIVKWMLNNTSIPETIYQSEHIIKSIEVSSDGKVLMAVFYETGLSLIPLDKNLRKDIGILEDPEPVQTATFLPNERKYLSVSNDGELVIKGFNSQQEQVGQTALKVNQLKIDKEETVFAGTSEGVLEAWEKPYEVKESPIDDIMKEWKQQSYFGYELGSFAIKCLDISPDGNLLAIGRERGDVILWNIQKKALSRLISGHQSTVTDLQFSPNGKLLLTTSRDHTARIWDLTDSRKLPIILDDHNDWVYAGSFGPDGEKVLTGSGDGYIRSWPVDPAYFADRICQLVSRNMTKNEWDEFVGSDIPYKISCAE